MPLRPNNTDMLTHCDAFSEVVTRKTFMNKSSEWQIIQAYLRLLLAPRDDDGAKHVALARIGVYEVRLCEHDASEDAFAVWLELYAWDRRCAIDSCGCCEFEQAVIAADEFILQARRLHQRSMQS